MYGFKRGQLKLLAISYAHDVAVHYRDRSASALAGLDKRLADATGVFLDPDNR